MPAAMTVVIVVVVVVVLAMVTAVVTAALARRKSRVDEKRAGGASSTCAASPPGGRVLPTVGWQDAWGRARHMDAGRTLIGCGAGAEEEAKVAVAESAGKRAGVEVGTWAA